LGQTAKGGSSATLAVASHNKEVLVVDVKPSKTNGVKARLARDGSRAIFIEVAEEMAKAVLEAEVEAKVAGRL
jgi:hypothetical protein